MENRAEPDADGQFGAKPNATKARPTFGRSGIGAGSILNMLLDRIDGNNKDRLPRQDAVTIGT